MIWAEYQYSVSIQMGVCCGGGRIQYSSLSSFKSCLKTHPRPTFLGETRRMQPPLLTRMYVISTLIEDLMPIPSFAIILLTHHPASLWTGTNSQMDLLRQQVLWQTATNYNKPRTTTLWTEPMAPSCNLFTILVLNSDNVELARIIQYAGRCISG